MAGAEQCFDRKSCLKMSSRKAETIFWNTPELIENLLRFLDPATIVCLARSHGFTLKILQGSVPWGNLIRRCCPQGDGNPGDAVIREVFPLAFILEMMEDPQTVLLPLLLDLICERFSAPMHCKDTVKLACAQHRDGHLVTDSVFWLLEMIEAKFGTAKQQVEAVEMETLHEGFVLALAARVSRQDNKITLFSAQNISLNSDEGTKAFNTLVAKIQSWVPFSSDRMLLLVGSSSEEEEEEEEGLGKGFGEEGWKTLAETLQLHPGMVRVVSTTKETLDRGRKEDLRKLWEIMGPEGRWLVESGGHQELLVGEHSWERLEQVLEMTADEWAAQEEEGEEDEEGGESGEDDGGEGEDDNALD